MGIREKETQRKSVVETMVSTGTNSSRGAEIKDKPKRKQKGFRLSVEVAKALAVAAAKTGEDQEEIVERLLRDYLKDEIEKIM